MMDLSKRKLEIVRLVVRGMPSRDVAQRLGLQVGTVKTHLHQIYKSTGVANRTALAGWYARHKRAASR